MRLIGLVGAVVVVACGGGGDAGTPPPAPVASVSITPGGVQSTTLCGEVNFTAQARDAQNNLLSKSFTWTSSSSANVVVPPTGQSVAAIGVGVGSSTITASADGVPSSGVPVTVAAGGAPGTTAGVSATAPTSFSPTCVVIAAGGNVTWTFGATEHNVQFDAPAAPAGGNIPGRTNTTEQRTFPTAGHYSYQCTLHQGMRGRVIVQ